VLKQCIVGIARRTPGTEVNVIFEGSGRADRLVENAFGDFTVSLQQTCPRVIPKASASRT
jgi:hypothetical protein